MELDTTITYKANEVDDDGVSIRSNDSDNEEEDNDRDHLAEIQEMLEGLDEEDDGGLGDEVYRQLRFDLCPDCRQKFLKNPLTREPAKQFDFSEN